jgi:hypothetical protein
MPKGVYPRAPPARHVVAALLLHRPREEGPETRQDHVDQLLRQAVVGDHREAVALEAGAQRGREGRRVALEEPVVDGFDRSGHAGIIADCAAPRREGCGLPAGGSLPHDARPCPRSPTGSSS